MDSDSDFEFSLNSRLEMSCKYCDEESEYVTDYYKYYRKLESYFDEMGIVPSSKGVRVDCVIDGYRYKGYCDCHQYKKKDKEIQNNIVLQKMVKQNKKLKEKIKELREIIR